jgi:hypothetical protein
MKKLRFITFHYVSLLVAVAFYFSKFPSAYSQNLNWVKQISGNNLDYLKGMTTDANGNIYVVGGFAGTIDFDPGPGVVSAGPAFGSDIWFGKYSSTGNLIWAHALIGGDDDFGTDIALDNSGNVYITGYFGTQTSLDFDPGPGNAPPTVAHGLFVAKYNNNGVYQWVKTIGHNNVLVRSNAIAVDGSGNCYIAGTLWTTQTSQVNFNPSGSANLSTANGSVFYAKYSSTGTYIWAKNVGPGNSISVECRDLALDASNNVYITGTFNGTADFHPSGTTPTLNSSAGAAYVCKYNSSGNYVWTKQVGGQNGDVGRACAVDASNNVYVTGSYNTAGENIFLTKFNSSGTQLILKNIGGSTYNDRGQSLRLEGSSIYLAGLFRGTNIEFNPDGPPAELTSALYHDFFLAKYATSNLNCQWARRMDLQLDVLDPEVNALVISSGKIVAAGNFKGSGDFNTCASSTAYNATTLDAFIVGYNTQNPPIGITGPYVICAPGTLNFTIQNAPPGAAVTWSVSPANLVDPSTGSGNTFNTTLLAGVTSGTLTVTATVAGECGGVFQRSVHIGLPDNACTPDLVLEPCNTLHATTCSGGPTFNWYIDGNLVLTSEHNEVYISLILNPLLPGYHSLCVETQNDCGTSPQACSYFITGDCEYGQYAIGYPNPTHEEINFTLLPGEKEFVDFEYSYALLDKGGMVVKSGSTSKNTLVIDVRDLKKDTYFFKVQLPGQRIEQRIIID